MAKKRKSKLFRGNTKKMLTQGVSLASMFPKLKDLEESQSEDKSAREAEALIEEERLQDEVLQSKGQDLWGMTEDEDASPIRIQLHVDAVETEGLNEEISKITAHDNLEDVHRSRIVNSAYQSSDEDDGIAEHLRSRYKSIAGITERNYPKDQDSSRQEKNLQEGLNQEEINQGEINQEEISQEEISQEEINQEDINKKSFNSSGIVNIFEANLPLEEDEVDDIVIQRREKRYRNREKENSQKDIFKEILSRALLETPDESVEGYQESNETEKSEIQSVEMAGSEIENLEVENKIDEINKEKNPSELKGVSSEHYIEENFGLDILDSDLFDYHHLKDISPIQDKTIEKSTERQDPVSKKYLFVQIDKDLREEDSSTDPNIDEIPDVIFSLNTFEDDVEKNVRKLEQEEDGQIEVLQTDPFSLELPLRSGLDVTDPQIEPHIENDEKDFQSLGIEVPTTQQEINEQEINEQEIDDESHISDISSNEVSEKKYFARPLLPMDEDGIPSVIIEEWDFEDSESGLDTKNDLEDHSEEHQEQDIDTNFSNEWGDQTSFEKTEIDATRNRIDEEERTMVSLSTSQSKSSGAILYLREEGDEKAGEENEEDVKDEDNTDGSIFAFEDEIVTDGIQVNLGHTDDTVLGEDAWNISLEKDEDLEPTIHENARPVPILRLKSKRSQRRRQISTENFTPISKEELDDGTNPILESQRITIGQSSSKFPLFLITFILGVLIFAFVAAC